MAILDQSASSIMVWISKSVKMLSDDVTVWLSPIQCISIPTPLIPNVLDSLYLLRNRGKIIHNMLHWLMDSRNITSVVPLQKELLSVVNKYFGTHNPYESLGWPCNHRKGRLNTRLSTIPMGRGVSTNHKSSNRIELSWLGQDLLNF